jgi:hypothetical protein
MAHTGYPNYSKKHKKEDCGPGWPGQKERTCLQNTRTKRAGIVFQVLKFLISKHEKNIKDKLKDSCGMVSCSKPPKKTLLALWFQTSVLLYCERGNP